MDPKFSALLDQVLPGIRIVPVSGEMQERTSPPSYIHSADPAKIDPRIKQLSYSSLLTLHACPKKFQLQRLRYEGNKESDLNQEITFSFGHVVGAAIQSCLDLSKPTEQIILEAFLQWKLSIMDVDTRRKKSFFDCVHAIQSFRGMQYAGFLDGWDILQYENKPAMELSYSIELDHGFINRGFVDAVMVNHSTKEVRVIEIKTDGSAAINPARYKNSSQGVGYSTVLDTIYPGTSSYEVLYLVYSTVKREWNVFPFTKSNLNRAIWLRQLKYDMDHIIEYEANAVYPMHGESCTMFGRDCPFLQVCSLDPGRLAVPYNEELHMDRTEYQIRLKFDELIDAQLEK